VTVLTRRTLLQLTALQPQAPADLLIRNATLVDGTGAPARPADLLVRDGRIAALGELGSVSARRTIDARGLVLAPGFIDMHNHSDETLIDDPRCESMIRQGVTTMVLGEGNSAGPIPAGLREWSTMGGYFDFVAGRGVATNICSYVGQTQIWIHVKGNALTPATPAELERMKEEVARAMREGTMGLSTSLLMPPSSLITTPQLIELAKVARQHGGIYSTHIRDEGQGVYRSVNEAIEIARGAKIRVDIIHLKIADQKLWGQMKEVIAMIDKARAEGLDVRANLYPYTAGQNNLRAIIPPWAHDGGNAKMLERLRSPALRPRLKREIREGLPNWYNHYLATGGGWAGMLLVTLKSPQYAAFTGKRMSELIAAQKGQEDVDVLFDVLLAENGSVPCVYFHHSEADMTYALRQPYASVGSDGAAIAVDGPAKSTHPHPRWYGTFPRILGRYVREQKALTLEAAVHKMTQMNADKIGLKERGVLKAGYAADLTLFDPNTVNDRATYENPHQYPAGIPTVIVNGQVVLDQGRHTGAKPGRVLRGPSYALLACLALLAPAMTAQDFSTTLRPVLEKAGCPACHAPDGVAAATRLSFPPADAPAAKWEAFGRSLVELTAPVNLLRDKPTGRVAHAGGTRFAAGSEADAAVEAWVRRLNQLTPAERAEALKYREREAAGLGYERTRLFLRRLTHHEYNNIVRDLLGDSSQPASQFPPEDFVNGFKTQYQGQSLSPLLFEAYSQAAEKIARNALRRGAIPRQANPQWVAQFGRRAFRRPLTGSERDRYQTLLAKGGPVLVVEAMLQSPAFLFRLEETDQAALQPYAAASRLAFTLWSTLPDEELLAAAERGELAQREGIRQQAQRLLADDRARENFDEFTAQWLRFDRLLGAAKSRRLYPRFNREAAVAMTEEARRFLRDLAFGDRNFMDFLTDPHGYMTADLAAIYEAPVPAREYERIPFPAQSERAGLLGQAFFLASTAKPDDTSPTARGLFVREQLLCQHVPPPPPGVDTNLPVLSEDRPLTNKERLQVHLSSPSCAGCHTLIDPIGLAFEKFDAIGGRREVAKLVFAAGKDKEEPRTVELPLDTRGYLAGIRDARFQNPRELGELLARQPACQECVVKQLFRFASGRMETRADRPLLARLTARFRDSQFRFETLMLELAIERTLLPTGER
jgi:dihydroorotase/N-acyl-D-amino-acid deacylase